MRSLFITLQFLDSFDANGSWHVILEHRLLRQSCDYQNHFRAAQKLSLSLLFSLNLVSY